jgi:hypothetical protein
LTGPIAPEPEETATVHHVLQLLGLRINQELPTIIDGREFNQIEAAEILKNLPGAVYAVGVEADARLPNRNREEQVTTRG